VGGGALQTIVVGLLLVAQGPAFGPGDAPGRGADPVDRAGVWSWEGAEGDLRFGRWEEIPAPLRPRARRVTTSIETVSRERSEATAPRSARPPEEGHAAWRCALLDDLRRRDDLPGAAARPEIALQEERSDYVVGGLTPAEIRSDLNSKRQGPFDAHTGWKVDWRWSRDAGTSDCRIGRPTVSLRVTQRLPRLGPTTGRDQVVDRQWATYLGRLEQHEAGHRAIGVAAANDILVALSGLAGRPCRAEEEALASQCARSILGEYRLIEERFDGRTRHGMAAGAVFP